MWTRISIDVRPGGEVAGYSAEVHVGDEIVDIIVWPVAPDVSPFDVLVCALADLRRRFGEQLAMELF